MTKTPKVIGAVERTTAWVGSVASLAVHTIAFLAAFAVGVFGIASWELVLLILTTVVSLEAIYLAIFIQMTVNRNTESLREVEEDIDELQEDVEEIGEDIDEIQEDVEEITEDLDEIQEDVEEMSEEDKEEERRVASGGRGLDELTSDIRKILAELEALKGKK